MVGLAVIKADYGLVRVGIAVENKNPCLGGLRGYKEVERENGAAAALIALSPIVWPPVDLFHGIGEECLLGGELGFIVGAVEFLDESFVDVTGFTSLKTVNGGIANVGALAEEGLVPFNPVVDDAVFSRLVIEEAVYVIHDDHVYIQKQRGSFEIGKTILCDGQFGENSWPVSLILIPGIGRERLGINTFIQPCRIICDADEAERPVKMFFDRTVKSIGVSCGITGTPFQADYVTGGILAHSVVRLTLSIRYVKKFRLSALFFVTKAPPDAANLHPGGGRIDKRKQL